MTVSSVFVYIIKDFFKHFGLFIAALQHTYRILVPQPPHHPNLLEWAVSTIIHFTITMHSAQTKKTKTLEIFLTKNNI